MATVAELIGEAAKALGPLSSTPRLDAELLAAHVLGKSRPGLIAASRDSVSISLERRFREALARRLNGEPIAYILGAKEFWGLDFKVSPAVLVPRPETELLVEIALDLCASLKAPRVADLGTGSGCIAVAVAHELKKRGASPRILAVDLSPDAIAVASENVARHRLSNEVTVALGDWLSALPASEKFDLILSNPPYIALGDTDVSPETGFEPRSALYSGPSGIEAISKILSSAGERLRDGASIAIEIGSGQRPAIIDLMKSEPVSTMYADRMYEIRKDLSGLDRVLLVRPRGHGDS